MRTDPVEDGRQGRIVLEPIAGLLVCSTEPVEDTFVRDGRDVLYYHG